MGRIGLAAGLFAIGFVLRLGTAEVLLARGGHRLPDSELYEVYAHSIYRGEPYRAGLEAAQRAPGYPAFVALSWQLAGEPSQRAVLWAQAVVSTLACGLVWAIARKLEGTTVAAGTGSLALALAVFDPYAVVLAGMILSETVFIALLNLGCLISVVANQRRSPRWAFLLGLVAAAAVLVRPSALVLGPLAASLWGLVARDRRVFSRLVLAAGLGWTMGLAPWWIRNVWTLGAFVPTTTNVGASLYDGLNPQATGASSMLFKFRLIPVSEVEQDRYWRAQAIKWARENPERVLWLAGIKFWRFWSPWPNEPQFRTPWLVAVTTAGTLPVLVLAAWGVWVLQGEWRTVLFCLLPAGYFCGLHLVFVSSVRYRAPAMPMLEILAAAALAWVLGRRAQANSMAQG